MFLQTSETAATSWRNEAPLATVLEKRYLEEGAYHIYHYSSSWMHSVCLAYCNTKNDAHTRLFLKDNEAKTENTIYYTAQDPADLAWISIRHTFGYQLDTHTRPQPPQPMHYKSISL